MCGEAGPAAMRGRTPRGGRAGAGGTFQDEVGGGDFRGEVVDGLPLRRRAAGLLRRGAEGVSRIIPA